MRAVSTTNRWISVKNWFVRPSNCSKKLTSVTNRAFSVQHACGLSTTPTLLACADATAHAQTLCRKGSSSHKTALQRSVAILLAMHVSHCADREFKSAEHSAWMQHNISRYYYLYQSLLMVDIAEMWVRVVHVCLWAVAIASYNIKTWPHPQ